MKNRKAKRLIVDTAILNKPDAMSPLGRILVSIRRKIEKSGAKPRSLREIHRELAMR